MKNNAHVINGHTLSNVSWNAYIEFFVSSYMYKRINLLYDIRYFYIPY